MKRIIDNMIGDKINKLEILDYDYKTKNFYVSVSVVIKNG